MNKSLRLMLVVATVGVLTAGLLAWADNEITLSALLKADKQSRSVLRQPGTLTVTWNGNRYYGPTTFTATNTYQALAKGTVNTNGYAFMRNVSTAGVAVISFNGGTNDHLRLKAGEYALMRLDTTLPIDSLMVKCATTNDFEFTLIED